MSTEKIIVVQEFNNKIFEPNKIVYISDDPSKVKKFINKEKPLEYLLNKTEGNVLLSKEEESTITKNEFYRLLNEIIENDEKYPLIYLFHKDSTSYFYKWFEIKSFTVD